MKKVIYHSRIVVKVIGAIIGLGIFGGFCWYFGQLSLLGKIVGALVAIIAGLVGLLNVAAIFAKQSSSSLVLDKLLRFFPKKDRTDPEYVKEAMAESSKPYHLPDDIREKYRMSNYGSFTDTFVMDHSQNSKDPVIFYLHGGGYWVQPVSLHYMFFDKIAKAAQAKLILPLYPLAPANTAVAVNENVRQRYLSLLADGVSNEQIIFMGDSAGAGLALALMQSLRDENLPLPKKAILLSPWVDVTNSVPGTKEVHDPFDNVDNLTYGGQLYAGNLSPKDPMVSPMYGSLKALPPITIFGGTYDALNVAVEKMVQSAIAKKLPVTYYCYPKMVHGFSGFFFTPEAKDSFKKIRKEILEN